MKKIVSDKTRQASQRPGKGSTFGPHKTIQNEAPKILTPEKKDANRKKKNALRGNKLGHVTTE